MPSIPFRSQPLYPSQTNKGGRVAGQTGCCSGQKLQILSSFKAQSRQACLGCMSGLVIILQGMTKSPAEIAVYVRSSLLCTQIKMPDINRRGRILSWGARGRNRR